MASNKNSKARTLARKAQRNAKLSRMFAEFERAPTNDSRRQAPKRAARG